MFEALKQALPESKIAVAAAGTPFEVVRDNPFVDLVWHTPGPDTNFIGAVKTLRRSMRLASFQPDWICFNYWNQRTTTVLLGALVTGSRRLGFAIDSGLLDLKLSYDSNLSMIDNNLRLLSALDLEADHVEPKIFFSTADLERSNRLLPGGPGSSRRRAALLVRGSGTKPTAWYDQRFAEIGDFLYRELDFDVVFLGQQQDAAKIDDLRTLMKEPSINLAGKTTVGELAAIIASCDIGVGIDTGGMHVARAVGLPFVLTAAAFEPAHPWLPINQPQIITIQKSDISCRYCNRNVCATRECMDEIGTDEVKRAIHSLLQRYPPSVASRDLRVSHSLAQWRRRSDGQMDFPTSRNTQKLPEGDTAASRR
jgi:ADP-heptose:LPS heptosyltransferase